MLETDNWAYLAVQTIAAPIQQSKLNTETFITILENEYKTQLKYC